ncbi:MAG: hypothetical protein K2M07_01385 [Muribaculaceae bacterium]|nr:hypothetical protein [Muribaculaceae bacterium]
MSYFVFTVVLALILIFAMPHIISATVRRRGNRKGLSIICRIIGWVLLILAIVSLIRDLL